MTISNYHYGPTLPLSQEIDREKYRQEGEDFYQKVTRIAQALKDGGDHFEEFRDALRHMRFLPAGHVQNAVGKRVELQHSTVLSVRLSKIRWTRSWQ